MGGGLLVTTTAYLTTGVGFCVLGLYIVVHAPGDKAILEMLIMYSGGLVVLWGLLLILLGRSHLHKIANAEKDLALKIDE